MSRLDHIIPSAIAEASSNPGQVQRQTAIYGATPPLRAREEWTGAGLTRTVTIQVITQRRAECKGRFLVGVLLGANAAPVSCTYAVTGGEALDVFTETQGGLFLTDETGALELEVTQTGSWSTLAVLVTSISPWDGTKVADWTPNAASVPAGGTQSGTATADFGAAGYQASVVVTGQTWVEAGSMILAQVAATATADHDAEDAALEGLTCYVGDIVAGTGFTIYVNAPLGTFGEFDINWLGV